jgi:hypothetical protein
MKRNAVLLSSLQGSGLAGLNDLDKLVDVVVLDGAATLAHDHGLQETKIS